jgi:superoxide dismutase, Fe-Mn family
MATPHPTARSTSTDATFQARKFDLTRVQGLSQRAIEVHLSLYEGYVKESNALLPLVRGEPSDGSPAAKLQTDGLARRFAFERNGMELHELFFDALRGAAEPPRAQGAFLAAATAGFGGFDGWKANVAKLAQTRGIGWVLTLIAPREHRLVNVWIDDHTRGLMANARIVCVFDLWEHAYLLDFQPTQKPQYVQVLFDNMDWQVVESRCQ